MAIPGVFHAHTIKLESLVYRYTTYIAWIEIGFFWINNLNRKKNKLDGHLLVREALLASYRTFGW
jgi:hypothetical protein